MTGLTTYLMPTCDLMPPGLWVQCLCPHASGKGWSRAAVEMQVGSRAGCLEGGQLIQTRSCCCPRDSSFGSKSSVCHPPQPRAGQQHRVHLTASRRLQRHSLSRQLSVHGGRVGGVPFSPWLSKVGQMSLFHQQLFIVIDPPAWDI